MTATPPLLLPTGGGTYRITGAGFVAGVTELFVEGRQLTSAAGPPAAGEFLINAAGTQVDFQLPAALGPGRYPLRVRVNGIESDPNWWVQG